MRTDLVIGDLIGNIGAQLIHAAEAYHAPPHTNSAALCLPNEAELQRLRDRLVADGIEHCPITETEGAYAGQLMAIGMPPAPKSKFKKYLSSIPTLKLGRLAL